MARWWMKPRYYRVWHLKHNVKNRTVCNLPFDDRWLNDDEVEMPESKVLCHFCEKGAEALKILGVTYDELRDDYKPGYLDDGGGEGEP